MNLQEKIQKYKIKFGIDINEYYQALETYIRVNTLKIDVDKVVKELEERGYTLEKLPYADFAFKVLNKDKIITKELEYAIGYIFSHDASSILVPIILEPNENEYVLDLCAAPGGKTTEIAQLMNNKGFILANDMTIDRIKALASNIQRMGVLNTIISMEDGRFLYKKIQNFFDKVLVDAPCSATGTFKLDAINAVSKRSLERISKIQRSLLKSAYFMTKKEGIIVYSTCSLEIEENEAVIDWFIKNFNVELLDIKVRGIELRDGYVKFEDYEFDKEIAKTKRIVNKGQESFFIAKMKKL
ncbi:MAG: RsmB/NOP family class I SAM-dependent RNA methyltransferase [Candidatus Aenigmatarchaeota archaeon]